MSERHHTAFKAPTPREAADVAAIAARLIPTTDTPGATEAGVEATTTYFIVVG